MTQLPDNLMLSDGSEQSTNGRAASLARQAGHSVASIIYPGDGYNDELDGNYLINDSHMRIANRYLLRANKSMHRSWPRQQMATDNGLRRDLYLVRWSERVYMFGLFTQDASLLKVHSEAAWAAQMYIDRFLYDREPYEMCEMFMFDMKSESWWRWNKQWAMVASVPKPRGVYTVLGNDRLSNAGKSALAALWG